MGTIQHHAFVVTGHSDNIWKAHEEANRAFGGIASVTSVVPSPWNGFASFMIAPDGSKEEWKHSDDGDLARAKFVKWLRENDLYRWVEVTYGADACHVVNTDTPE